MEIGTKSHISHAKERVLAFEKEYCDRLSALAPIEKEIMQVSEYRTKWLHNVSTVDVLDTEIFQKRIEVIKKKSELLYTSLASDLIRLEGTQEAHSLNFLVLATKPLDPKETQHHRDEMLSAMMSQQASEWKEALKRSLRLRSEISVHHEDLSRDCEKVKLDYEMQSSSLTRELTERISQYIKHLREDRDAAKLVHRQITADYLVLRHNARVSQQLIFRNQNEASRTRIELKEKLDAITADAQLQREHMENASAAEIKILTDNIRDEVVKREIVLDDLHSRISENRRQLHSEKIGYKSSQRDYSVKYKELQQRRKEELVKIEGNLRRLREMVTELSLQLQYQRTVASDAATQSPESVSKLFRSLSPPQFTSTPSQSSLMMGRRKKNANVNGNRNSISNRSFNRNYGITSSRPQSAPLHSNKISNNRPSGSQSTVRNSNRDYLSSADDGNYANLNASPTDADFELIRSLQKQLRELELLSNSR